ncbi:Nucleoside-diphosphate kinase [Limosilactobacillus fermentum F-6]|nr:Nucleoside-diphosphate kinase [Limosilactobacillus fermentum F-6]
MASGVDPAKERMMTMAEEWTLVLVKPDGVKNRHVGEVITRIERKGYQIIDLKMIEPTENKLRQHYADKVNEPYFAGLMSYMTEGPIVGIIVAGTNVVKTIHRMAGATNPVEAAWGTIRGDFGREWPDGNLRNVVHTSDNPANAKREIEIWFPERTVVDQ